MELSVVICTHDRASELSRTLAALALCPRPEGVSAEIVVVANACSDDTEAVAGAAGARVVREPRPGLSRARNAGIDASRGEAVLWLDDDATPAPGWLAAYADALRRHPRASFFGGPVRPEFRGPPPPWLDLAARRIPTTWSAIDLGPHDRPFRRGEAPFGGNMAIRRTALAGRFREDLGRVAGSGALGAGEETEYFGRLAAAGHRGLWAADAAVAHRIGPERQTLDYIARYWQGIGLQDRMLQAGRHRGRLPRPLREMLCYMAGRALGAPALWLPAFARMNRSLGRMAPVVEELPGGDGGAR